MTRFGRPQGAKPRGGDPIAAGSNSPLADSVVC